MRVERCRYCSDEFLALSMHRHYLHTCSKYPPKCPFCSQIQPTKDHLNQKHLNPLNGDCPKMIVYCSLRHFGCLYQDKRCNISKHYENATSLHFSLMSNHILKLENELKINLEQQAKKYETNLNLLREKVDLLSIKCQDLVKSVCNENKRKFKYKTLNQSK